MLGRAEQAGSERGRKRTPEVHRAKANSVRDAFWVERTGAKTEARDLPAISAIAAVSAISTAATTATASTIAATASTVATTAATTATSTGAFGLRPRFIHYQVPAPEVLTVEGSNRTVRFFIVCDFDESEAAGLSSKAVAN
jgi:hypothetical protein